MSKLHGIIKQFPVPLKKKKKKCSKYQQKTLKLNFSRTISHENQCSSQIFCVWLQFQAQFLACFSPNWQTNFFLWVLPLLDNIHCCKLSLYAIPRTTKKPKLRKWQKNLDFFPIYHGCFKEIVRNLFSFNRISQFGQQPN